MDLKSLNRGDGIVVTVGSKGTQYALVRSVAADGHKAKVCKWLARGARWTKPVTVYPVEVKARAEASRIPRNIMPLPGGY
jgi:hypothetical protein